MKKLLVMVCTLAVTLSIPALAQAKSERAQARADAIKTCKDLRAAAGKKNFRQSFGPYGKCVRQEKRENLREARQAESDARRNAAQECKAERSDPDFESTHGESFQERYGSNRNGKNAFGKCVSQKARANEREEDAENEQEDENQVNAARQCKAEKDDAEGFEAEHGETFAEHYGTNRNNRNAFGKCVSQKAQAQNEEDEQEQEEQEQQA